jgi:hypothetical protein
VLAAGLEADIDFAARLDAFDVVGRLIADEGDRPAVRAVRPPSAAG